MCFSKDAPLYALAFLYAHLLVYTLRTGRSVFAKEVKPFALLYCVAWIMMETFDYALWKAREDGDDACYGLVNVAGVLTIVPTISVYNAMIWYKRGKGMQVRYIGPYDFFAMARIPCGSRRAPQGSIRLH